MIARSPEVSLTTNTETPGCVSSSPSTEKCCRKVQRHQLNHDHCTVWKKPNCLKLAIVAGEVAQGLRKLTALTGDPGLVYKTHEVAHNCL